MKKKKLTIALATVVLAVGTGMYFFGGKIYFDYSIKKLFNESNNIKIIKETESIKDHSIASKLETYENVIGYDWLNDNEILATKENKNKDLVKTALGNFEVRNLAVYNLENKNSKIIANEDKTQKYMISSPDHKNIFYMEYISEFQIGSKAYITDLNGNVKAKIEVKNMSVTDFAEAKWINNEEVIMPYHRIKGAAILSINGEFRKINNIEEGDIEKGTLHISNIDKVNDNIYYTLIDANSAKERYTMKVYNLKTKKTKNFADYKIEDFKVSPNKSQFLITKINYDKKREISSSELILTDLDGKNEEIICKNIGIPYGQCWSPDSTKISYISSAEGVKMYDIKTKKNYLVISGDYYTPTKWSPSSKKIMVHTSQVDKNGNIERDNTSVITLK